MSTTIEEALARLVAIPELKLSRNEPLAPRTRFGIGGPAAVLVQTAGCDAFIRALDAVRESGVAHTVIGGGTNLIVADEGFRGVVLRYTADRTEQDGDSVTVHSGALLTDLVDFTVTRGLKGLETLAGIPGSVGGAVYGNAGAYGHSISERVTGVRVHDGSGLRVLNHAQCEFAYRDSVFKRRREWVILAAELRLERGDAAELTRHARGIVGTRNEKFPPTMKCAGSIFKNLILEDLPVSARRVVPAEVVREGKVPAAWFLDQAGARGRRQGGIRVAEYHANLVYNAGGGSARELCELIAELKARVRARFGLELEEEVQYVGFE